MKIFGTGRGEVGGEDTDNPMAGEPDRDFARASAPISADAVAASADEIDIAVAELAKSMQPTKVTHERLKAWLEDAGFAYFTDSDGDLGGIWHNRIFYLLALGANAEVLQVRGQWHREARLDHLSAILEVCNTWNGERIWPKSYARVRDDGTVVACTDLTIDVEHGATDAQLDLLLRCGLATGTAFFDRLDEEFPDPLTLNRAY